MPGHFSETLEGLLAPVWARSEAAAGHRDAPVLAVLCRALDAGYEPKQVAVWLRQAHSDVTTRGEKWFRLVTSARKHAGSSDSFLLAAARAGIGHLLSPAVGQPRSVASDKAIFLLAMSAALAAATSRMDTFFLTDTFLAKLSGISTGAASLARRRLVARGWIRPVSKRGFSTRYRLGRLAEVERAGAWFSGETVDALVSGRPETDPLAQVLATARHPAWWYGLSGRHLLAAIARASALPPEVFGLSARAYRGLIREVPEGDPVVWQSSLALKRGAFEKADLRERKMTEESARRAEVLSAFRAKRAAENAAKARSRAALKTAWAVVGTPPKASAPRPEVEAWMGRARQLFVEHPLPADLAGIVPGTIAWQLSARGWDPATAARMAGYLQHSEAPVADLTAWEDPAGPYALVGA